MHTQTRQGLLDLARDLRQYQRSGMENEVGRKIGEILTADAHRPQPMTFAEFSKVNRKRCEAPNGFNHPLAAPGCWSLSDWMTATMGELGEAANIAKKLNRVRDGIPGNTETPEQLRAALQEECADVFIYLDLLCQSRGFFLEDAVRAKFNKTSAKIGCDIVAPAAE